MDIVVTKKYSGNRTVSVFNNFVDYCQINNLDLKVEIKRISKEFGTMCEIENNDLLVRGHFSTRDFNKIY